MATIFVIFISLSPLYFYWCLVFEPSLLSLTPLSSIPTRSIPLVSLRSRGVPSPLGVFSPLLQEALEGTAPLTP